MPQTGRNIDFPATDVSGKLTKTASFCGFINFKVEVGFFLVLCKKKKKSTTRELGVSSVQSLLFYLNFKKKGAQLTIVEVPKGARSFFTMDCIYTMLLNER